MCGKIRHDMIKNDNIGENVEVATIVKKKCRKIGSSFLMLFNFFDLELILG